MNQDPPRNILVTGVFPALSTTTLPRADSFSNDVLFELKEMPLRTCDVARVTEKTRAYVDSYLRRLRNQGLIEKHGSFWNLSVLGASYVGYLEKIEDRRSRSRHNNNTTTTNKQHKVDTSKPDKPKQVLLLPFLRNLSLPDVEGRVVEVLMRHYDETLRKSGTGSPFIYVESRYDFANECGLSLPELEEALANLHQDQRIYDIPAGQYRRKIGLKENFIRKLQGAIECGEAESGQCTGSH